MRQSEFKRRPRPGADRARAIAPAVREGPRAGGGLRTLEKIVELINNAFNEETLKEKYYT